MPGRIKRQAAPCQQYRQQQQQYIAALLILQRKTAVTHAGLLVQCEQRIPQRLLIQGRPGVRARSILRCHHSHPPDENLVGR